MIETNKAAAPLHQRVDPEANDRLSADLATAKLMVQAIAEAEGRIAQLRSAGETGLQTLTNLVAAAKLGAGRLTLRGR